MDKVYWSSVHSFWFLLYLRSRLLLRYGAISSIPRRFSRSRSGSES